eukprot:jgi/Botrbrau1/8334/Bobra.0081s0023.1
MSEEMTEKGKGLFVVTKSFFSGSHALQITTRQAPNEAVLEKTLTMPDESDISSGEPDQVGLDLWPASFYMCRYLPALGSFLEDTPVLELGCGVGMCGLLAARLGASSVLLTDYDDWVLGFARRNVIQNQLAEKVEVRKLDWREPATFPAIRYSLLFAADVLYTSGQVEPLLEVVKATIAERGVFVLAHVQRCAVTWDRLLKIPRLEKADTVWEKFKQRAKAEGFHAREVAAILPTSTHLSQSRILTSPSQHFPNPISHVLNTNARSNGPQTLNPGSQGTLKLSTHACSQSVSKSGLDSGSTSLPEVRSGSQCQPSDLESPNGYCVDHQGPGMDLQLLGCESGTPALPAVPSGRAGNNQGDEAMLDVRSPVFIMAFSRSPSPLRELPPLKDPIWDVNI